MYGKVIIITSLIVAAVIVSLGVYNYYESTKYGANYQRAIASEGSDVCATPPGYTDEEWRQHLGHHPDRYAQCL
ncbi:MAG: hypothetical protein J4473_01690 [Candidatus Aenigmarchaeota archaeon]|nr:hypothetical protein [Candidatus Aenigmarchaeota archaeon]